jgi:hypothetical protein
MQACTTAAAMPLAPSTPSLATIPVRHTDPDCERA